MDPSANFGLWIAAVVTTISFLVSLTFLYLTDLGSLNGHLAVEEEEDES
jgi:hypothetical protein